MTARLVFEAALTELSKVNAPSLLLHEFNYYFNKAVSQYINKRYNIYDISLLTTDDLRVLKATAVLDAKPIYDPELKSIQNYAGLTDIAQYTIGSTNLFGATYEVVLPDDYLHMLNCICIYKMLKSNRCYDKGNYIEFAATRLTADSWSGIINDYYHRPLPERPYYYIHNVNTSTTIPTNPVEIRYDGLGRSIGLKNCGTDMINKDYEVPPEGESIIKPITKANINDLIPGEVAPSEYPNFPRAIRVDDRYTISTVEKATAQRYGNASKVRCEIRYGRDSSVYLLEKVFIDYIKTPQTIRLTKEQMDLTEDTSLIMEFPDYVCQEIINELVILIMQRDADPRLQTLTIVTQSIANPAQQLTPQPQPQQRGN